MVPLTEVLSRRAPWFSISTCPLVRKETDVASESPAASRHTCVPHTLRKLTTTRSPASGLGKCEPLGTRPPCLWSLEESHGPETPESPSLESSQPYLILQAENRTTEFQPKGLRASEASNRAINEQSCNETKQNKEDRTLPGTRRKETFSWHLGQRPTLSLGGLSSAPEEASQKCSDKNSPEISVVLPNPCL